MLKYVAKTAMPGPLADWGIDIGMAIYSSHVRGLEKKETHDKWMKIYNATQLKAACS